MATIAEKNRFPIGQEATLSRTISDADIRAFATITGDGNPIHLDDSYAQRTRFGGRIAHGMLVGSLISAVLGAQLPGPGAIYLSQTLRFLEPVRPGDTVTAKVRVIEWDDTKGRVTLMTEVLDGQANVIIAGEAKLVMSAFLKAK